MSSCRCGHVLSVDDRFCAKCGLPASASAARSDSEPGSQPRVGALSAGDMPASDSEPILLSPASIESVETSSVVHSSFPTRWAVIGVLAVAAMMWGLYSWPQAEATSGSAEAAASADRSDGGPESDVVDVIEGDEIAESDDRPEQADDIEDNSIVVERDGDTGTKGDSDGDLDDEGGSESVGPLVGEPTGLSLAVGSYDEGRPIRLVSLDTGDEVELRGVSGRPIGMIGSHLVVAQWNAILTVDVASDERDGTVVFASEFASVNTVSIDDGKIWTVVDEEGGQLQLVGFSVDGEVIERRELFGFSFYFGTPGVGDLVSSDVGGVYRRRGPGYERLSTGRLRAVGEAIALVDECDDDLRCTSVWYEREGWKRAELPSPEFAHLGWTQVAGNDRWLATAGLSGNTMELVDIATGEVEQTFTELTGLGPFLSLPISDDGRWLFSRTPTGGSMVIDLDSGMEWPIKLALNPNAVVGIVDLTGIALDSR